MVLSLGLLWALLGSESWGGILEQANGYRGIWYANQPSPDVYRYKYSGGMATYPQQHIPIAIYAAAADKTFFCYGGVSAEGELLHMVSYYDHRTGLVPRPTILLNKHTEDAHDNPTLQIDDDGTLWVFSNAHGQGRPSFVHRSLRPYAIDAFEEVWRTNFSYSQPWFVPGRGFLFLHTRYGAGVPGGLLGRSLFWMTRQQGSSWTSGELLAHLEKGDYQVSWRWQDKVGTAFDYHPAPVGLNARANIYYVESEDLGAAWRTVRGDRVTIPLTDPRNPALVYDSRKEGLLVYLKDLAFDAEGRPIVLFLTSPGFESGPVNDPRTWRTAQWTGEEWRIRVLTTSDHNYDHGSLYVEADGTWRVIAPTEPGPQAYNPGGEMVMWRSRNEARTWKRVKQLTRFSFRNHTYARRPVNAHPDFYALWADGDARRPSESYLYFTDRKGRAVWRLPSVMQAGFASPERVR